jgi:hypothetical protein
VSKQTLIIGLRADWWTDGQTLNAASKTALDNSLRASVSKAPSPTKPFLELEMSDDEGDGPSAAPLVKPNYKRRPLSTATLSNDAWEVLTDGDASLLMDDVGNESMSSHLWKSANNGKKLDDFGGLFSFLFLSILQVKHVCSLCSV